MDLFALLQQPKMDSFIIQHEDCISRDQDYISCDLNQDPLLMQCLLRTKDFFLQNFLFLVSTILDQVVILTAQHFEVFVEPLSTWVHLLPKLFYVCKLLALDLRFLFGILCSKCRNQK
jgi:hypothetical protein